MATRTPNLILASIDEREWDRIATHLVPATLRQGDIIQEADEPIQRLYFPGDCIVSVVAPLSEGHTGEGVVTGRFGAVGYHGLFPGGTAPGRMVVHLDGQAQYMPIEAAREVVPRLPALQEALQRWANYALAQALQTGACARTHLLRARLSRWLLQVADQVGKSEITITQELLSDVLGVTRPSLSLIVGELHREGMVSTHRGRITVQDREQLMGEACECYGAIRNRLGAIFGHT